MTGGAEESEGSRVPPGTASLRPPPPANVANRNSCVYCTVPRGETVPRACFLPSTSSTVFSSGSRTTSWYRPVPHCSAAHLAPRVHLVLRAHLALRAPRGRSALAASGPRSAPRALTGLQAPHAHSLSRFDVVLLADNTELGGRMSVCVCVCARQP